MMHLRESIVLGIMAAIAFATVLFGSSGLFDSANKAKASLTEERQFVIESAQLWYCRPEVRGGGNAAFDSVDFFRLGFTDQPGNFDWNGKAASYRILSRTTTQFVLETIATTGTSDVDTIEFDTLIE